MKRSWLLLFILFLCAVSQLFAGNPSVPKVQNFKTHQTSFVENKGQLADENGRQSPDIKYYIHDGGVNVYCRPGKISFVFTKTEDTKNAVSEATGLPVSAVGVQNPEPLRRFDNIPSKSTINRPLPAIALVTARADLVLLNSNPASQILASDQQEYYENYYTAYTPEEGITHVHTFKTITYKSIYPNIDMVLHSQDGGMKYEFVVYPGGKVSDIQIQWGGLAKIKRLKNLKIEYSFALGKMEESKPVSFQDNNEICSDFKLNDNRIGFDIDKYDKTKTLVIDPTLEWGTYFGGSGKDYVNAISTDIFGNSFLTGYTLSNSKITTSGVHQIYNGGLYDAFLAKFNSSGSLNWATYYGGIGNDYGYGLNTDALGNVFITGWTNSSNAIANLGAFQSKYGGGSGDAFLVKFSSLGIRQWGTYFGGNKIDYATAISIDGSGNLFITGMTDSQSGIATAGTHQTSLASNLNNNTDVFIAKFNNSGSLQWATYYGGTSNEIAYGISTDFSGNSYIIGWTGSNSGIATSNAFQTSYTPSGGQEVFLAKFDNTRNLMWGTYYGYGESYGSSIATDNNGNSYITGYVQRVTDFATSGAYQTSITGSNTVSFLAKFNNSGNRIWATYYGGSESGVGNGICLDHSQNIYITGETLSTTGVSTSGSYQSLLTGAGRYYDAYLAKFSNSGSLVWATYYGGNNGTEANAVCVDAMNNIYITGWTSSTVNMATSGAFQTNFGGGITDVFIAKFSPPRGQNDAGITAIIAPNDTLCPGDHPLIFKLHNFGASVLKSALFEVTINGKIRARYTWQGSLLPDSTLTSYPWYYYFPTGSDTVKCWLTNPNGVFDSFPENDTSILIVYASPLPTATAGPDTTLCYNETYTMQGAGGITYLWTPAKYLSNDTIPAPKAIVPNTQLYKLYVRNKYGCEDSANVLLKVKPKLVVQINPVPSPVCYGSSVLLSAISSGGDTAHYVFSWPHDSMNGNPISKKIYQSGWHTVVLTDNCSGLPGLDSVYIAVTPRPKADFTILNRKPYLPDTAFRFQNQSKNASNYLWTFGDSSPSNNTINPVHIYTDSGTYKITLVAYGICTNDTGYGYIHIFSKYINIFIPDAFSPNGDGVNDVFEIKGLGFSNYDFTVYNRWGELLFTTSDANKFWDGTFRNELAPAGVYEYMITVTDQFSIKHYFSGNLTLMR